MTSVTHKDRPLFIKDLIRQVHDELLASQKERLSRDESPIFEVEKLTLEVNFIITDETEAKGGFNFKIITAGIGNKYTDQQIHKVTLSLTAVAQDNWEVEGLEKSGTHFRPRIE